MSLPPVRSTANLQQGQHSLLPLGRAAPALASPCPARSSAARPPARCPRRPLLRQSLPSPPGRAPPHLGLASGLPAAPGCPARRKPPGQELPPPQRPQPTARPDARGGGQWPDRTAAYGVPCGEVNPKGWRPLVTWCPTLARKTQRPLSLVELNSVSTPCTSQGRRCAAGVGRASLEESVGVFELGTPLKGAR